MNTDNMGIIDVLWRDEEVCIGLEQKRCRTFDNELVKQIVEQEWDIDVKHVEAHRTKKERRL